MTGESLLTATIWLPICHYDTAQSFRTSMVTNGHIDFFSGVLNQPEYLGVKHRLVVISYSKALLLFHLHHFQVAYDIDIL